MGYTGASVVDPYLLGFLIVKIHPNVQEVYMYFRGSGKAAEMKRQAMMMAI